MRFSHKPNFDGFPKKNKKNKHLTLDIPGRVIKTKNCHLGFISVSGHLGYSAEARK